MNECKAGAAASALARRWALKGAGRYESPGMNSLRNLRSGAALCLAAALLAGCIVAPVGPPRGEYVVGVAPPPPSVEVYGPPPVIGYLWIGGFWNWIGGRHVWVGGHWEAPRPHHRWVPHRWEPISGGWRLNPGRWDRDGR